MRKGRVVFVRYCTPYGSQEWLERHVAERRLRLDLKVWNREWEADQLTTRQLKHGPPRIEESTTTESR